MKKIYVIMGLMITGLLVISLVSAFTEGSETKRIYVKGDFVARGIAKELFGKIHEFPNAHSVEISQSKLKILKKIPGIEIEEVPMYYIEGTAFKGYRNYYGDCYPDNEYPWGVVKVNGGNGGEGVVVAVLDTGVDTDHPDLVGNLIDCYETSYETCEDGHSHGTHTAGTVLANGKIKGVAPSASLMAIKVCSDFGYCYADDVVDGIYYAINNGANIISMSFGGYYMSSTEREAIDNAYYSGLLSISSAGNNGPGEETMTYPAAHWGVMGVGAIDYNEIVPDWSSRGASDEYSAIFERELDVVAPGVYVESTFNDGCYGYKSGTSMAAPHVAGLAAKLWQETNPATRWYLNQPYSKDIYTPGHDTISGWGIPIAP